MMAKSSNIMAASVAATLTFGVGQASADHGTRGGFSDWAKVVDVEPVIRVVQVPTSHQECWDEPVYYQQPAHNASRYSYTPTIVGGIVGAVIGNQIVGGGGKGRHGGKRRHRGRDLATVAGGLLGASIGHDITSRRNYARNPGQTYTTSERRCHVVTDYREQEQRDGYRVTYRYQGQQFVTQMQNIPGAKIPVRVSVIPTN